MIDSTLQEIWTIEDRRLLDYVDKICRENIAKLDNIPPSGYAITQQDLKDAYNLIKNSSQGMDVNRWIGQTLKM